jgi:hypothetical protein
MATYTIVAEGTDPLGPNEIAAGGNIRVDEGDIFIVDSSADADTRFSVSGGGTRNIEIQINDDNTNGFQLTIRADITTDFNIADDVQAGSMNIRATSADSVTLTAGDNVEIGSYRGSNNGDTIEFGDNFVANGNITTGTGNDSITIGADANVQSISGGRGNDTIDVGANFTGVDISGGRGGDNITIGDGAVMGNITGSQGGDNITIGDNFTGNNVLAGGGTDTVNVGTGASIGGITGGGGTDTLLTQTPLPGASGFEIFCFVRGTLIQTATGNVPIEDIGIGDQVLTMDRGFQVVRWLGSTAVEGKKTLAPVCIRKGALGNDRDLWVSQQHRMMIDGWRAELLFGDPEVLVPAKHLVDGHGIEVVETDEVEYFHMLFDQHEIVFAEGLASESFHPGCVGMGAMSEAARGEILELFPSLQTDPANYGPSIRPSLRAHEGHLLAG